MSRFEYPAFLFAAVLSLSGLGAVRAEEARPASEIVIDVDCQQLKLVKQGQEVAKFPVSTSKFGLGDDWHSYKTPIGQLQVCEKMGRELPEGAVIKHGQFTGEVLPPNAPGRDPIVTRMIRLQGLESQNKHAFGRGIFIHGTPEEKRIGKPVSWGCIRMRSKDVVTLFKQVEVGTLVVICGTGHQNKTLPEQIGQWVSNLWS